jgi:hypothetical protein
MLIICSCFSFFNLIKLYDNDDECDMGSDHEGRSTVGAASTRRPTDNEAAKSFIDAIVEAVVTSHIPIVHFYFMKYRSRITFSKKAKQTVHMMTSNLESEPSFFFAYIFGQHISMCCSKNTKNKFCLFHQILFLFQFQIN